MVHTAASTPCYALPHYGTMARPYSHSIVAGGFELTS